MQQEKKRPWLTIILFSYVVCFIFRFIEYLIIRTDQSAIGEAFIHKLAGIAVLAAVLKYLHWQWSEIGFKMPQLVRHSLWGVILGAGVYLIGYGLEYGILLAGGSHPVLTFYVSSYSLDGNQVMESNALFFLICVAGNLINVIMEEGIFRGLFVRLGQKRLNWGPAMLLASMLFGLWHIAAPVRSFLDGNISGQTMLIASLLQVLITGIMGIKLCLLVRITGTLWMGMAEHFLNNFIVNILHVVTATGADEMQAIRISVAQTISFIIVLIWNSSAKKAISMKTAGPG